MKFELNLNFYSKVKPLGVIWGKFSEFYSKKNTIMFDDIGRNFLMNPQNGLKVRHNFTCCSHICWIMQQNVSTIEFYKFLEVVYYPGKKSLSVQKNSYKIEHSLFLLGISLVNQLIQMVCFVLFF